MIAEPNPRLESARSKFSVVASAGVALAGAAVVIGWWLDIALLRSVFPSLATMKANTALAFLLSGASLWLLQPQQPSQWRRRIAQACVGTVFLVGMLTLAQDLFGWRLHVDELLFRDATGSVKAPHPCRMAPDTALNFILIGCVLVVLDIEIRRGRRPAQLLALPPMIVASLGLIGYGYSVASFYRLASYTGMALHTALVFLVLSSGVLSARPRSGVMAIVTSGNRGGQIVLRGVPDL